MPTERGVVFGAVVHQRGNGVPAVLPYGLVVPHDPSVIIRDRTALEVLHKVRNSRNWIYDCWPPDRTFSDKPGSVLFDRSSVRGNVRRARTSLAAVVKPYWGKWVSVPAGFVNSVFKVAAKMYIILYNYVMRSVGVVGLDCPKPRVVTVVALVPGDITPDFAGDILRPLLALFVSHDGEGKFWLRGAYGKLANNLDRPLAVLVIARGRPEVVRCLTVAHYRPRGSEKLFSECGD